MDRHEKARLTRRLIEHVDNGTTDYAPSVLRVPSSSFDDPELTARERRVAAAFPHVVAHISEVGAPGQFITTELLGTPLLVVGQDDGSVAAFSNVCRHRGARVEFESAGCRKRFSCPYHRWTYARDGALKAVPFEEGFDDLDKARSGLVELPSEVRYGLVWVVPTPAADIDLAKTLGHDLDTELLQTAMSDSFQHRKETFHQDMNWKLVVDGVQDVYHLAFLHPKTVGPFFHTNVFTLDQHERAWRLVVARRSVTDIRDADPDDFDIERHAIGNYTIYPGTILVTEPGHFDVWSIAPDPDDHRAAIITLRMLVRERARDDKQARLYDKSWGLLLETLLNEDWFVSKTIGTNVAHGHVPELVYGRNEHPAQVFHRMISEDAEALR